MSRTILICGRCNHSFDQGDMVHTWAGNHWITTCVACNHAAFEDKALCDRISANHQHGLWMQKLAWKKAGEAARNYVAALDEREAPAAAGRLNGLVELLAQIEGRTAPEILLEVFKRAKMRLVQEDQDGSEDGGVRDSSPFSRACHRGGAS